MSKKELTCIGCPVGCCLTIEEIKNKDEVEFMVTGNGCRIGENYGKKESINPTRTVTSYVKVKNGVEPVLPIKTDKEIEKDKIFEVIKLLKNITVEAPVQIGDVIIENILETEVNIVATKNIEKNYEAE